MRDKQRERNRKTAQYIDIMDNERKTTSPPMCAMRQAQNIKRRDEIRKKAEEKAKAIRAAQHGVQDEGK